MRPPRFTRRRTLIGIAATLALAAGVAGLLELSREGDAFDPEVAFETEPRPAPEPPSPPRSRTDPIDRFVWPIYGYTKDRRRYLPAPSDLRPPFARLWMVRARVLLEFSPVIGGRSLYLLDNNGFVHAIAKKTGRLRWKRRLGVLAAASPAYGRGRVFVTVLARAEGQPGRVAALRARDGKLLWSRLLPSRTESPPLLDRGRLYFGSENGTVYALRASDGAVRWTFRADGPVKAGPALAQGKLYFGDYAGKAYAVRRSDGRQVWQAATRGATLGRAGQFYSTPAVAFGRVYLGNTDGKVYSFAADDGRVAWRRSTDGYVYAAPAVAQVPGGRPAVYVGSYDGTFYALDARSGSVIWTHSDGGRISGAATVVGRIVYYSNLGRGTTIGLVARTGRVVFRSRYGAFNPVVSDTQTIFLTGSTTLHALRPRSRRREGAERGSRDRSGTEARRHRAESASRGRARDRPAGGPP